MTPAEFRAIRESLGWSLRHIARVLGCDMNMPARWESGRAEIPPSIAAWLIAWGDHAARHPAPDDWRVRETGKRGR